MENTLDYWLITVKTNNWQVIFFVCIIYKRILSHKYICLSECWKKITSTYILQNLTVDILSLTTLTKTQTTTVHKTYICMHPSEVLNQHVFLANNLLNVDIV